MKLYSIWSKQAEAVCHRVSYLFNNTFHKFRCILTVIVTISRANQEKRQDGVSYIFICDLKEVDDSEKYQETRLFYI